MNYTKKDLVNDLVKQKWFTKKEAKDTVDAVLMLIVKNIKWQNPVRLSGFGSFTMKKFKKPWVNPKTLEKRIYDIERVSFKKWSYFKS